MLIIPARRLYQPSNYLTIRDYSLHYCKVKNRRKNTEGHRGKPPFRRFSPYDLFFTFILSTTILL